MPLPEPAAPLPRDARTTPLTAAPASATQLALELPSDVPAIGIPPEWKTQQRLWGHSFHPMCSYLASFPAALAHAFIARYSRPGDVVLDPFSGRGTTPLQAAAEGRIGVGNDLNPFAHLLTAAKLEPASRAEALTRVTQLRLAFRSDDRTDRFLAAALTGILHGRSASYLSTLMPNTFSMAPRYVRDFAARTEFQGPERDVFDGLEAKLRRLYREPVPRARGVALLGDARDLSGRARAALTARGAPDRARLVVTSPPYLRVVKYG